MRLLTTDTVSESRLDDRIRGRPPQDLCLSCKTTMLDFDTTHPMLLLIANRSITSVRCRNEDAQFFSFYSRSMREINRVSGLLDVASVASTFVMRTPRTVNARVYSKKENKCCECAHYVISSSSNRCRHDHTTAHQPMRRNAGHVDFAIAPY